VVGSGGNLSARHGDHVVVTAAGSWLDALAADEFAVVGLDGRPAADGPPPSSELALHLAAYRQRADVAAVVHLHPQASLLLDLLGHEPVLATTDHAFYVRRVRQVPFRPPGSAELAEEAGRALDGCDCVILERHGCSVVADSVDLAVRRAVNLEEAALLTWRALAVGAQLPPPPAAVRAWAEEAGQA
jgi:L-fuculose-phosphate aldolase